MNNRHIQTGVRIFTIGFFLGSIVTRMFHEAFAGVDRCNHGDSYGTDLPTLETRGRLNENNIDHINKNGVEGPPNEEEPVVKEKQILESTDDKEKSKERVDQDTEQELIKEKAERQVDQDTKHEIIDFQRQPQVVIGTKIHGEPHVPQLKQMLCLFTSAYNRRLNYDIVVFTTVPLPEKDIQDMQEIVQPAHLTVVTDKKTLHQQVAELTDEQRNHLLKRCNQTSVEGLSWGARCTEEHASTMPLAYVWQSEFRAKHLWRQDALKPYKYMLWIDSDAMCTEKFKQDPVAAMIRNDLVILFDNFPQGSTSGADVQKRIQNSFNQSLCRISLQDGHFGTKGGDCGGNTRISQIHGFFHVTNLDFFRSDIVLKWADILIGDTKFSRRWDDQLAVTVPPAILAPERAWDMRSHGIHLNVFHNGRMDGKEKWRGGGFRKWWAANGNNFTEALPYCKNRIVNGGR